MAQLPTFTWTIGAYDVDGGQTALFQNPAAGSIGTALNGIDSAAITVYLDDAVAPALRAPDTIIKVWREISGGGYSWASPSGSPDFAGAVSKVSKNGAQNTMTVIAQSPLHRLQSRFHILNHNLVIDLETGDKYDVSAMCWKLIDLVNGAWGDASQTGLVKGIWEDTFKIRAGFRSRKGDFVWTEVMQLLDSENEGIATPDLCGEYIDNGSSDLMYFSTSPARGSANTETVFAYCTGPKNLSNLTEDTDVTPENFANYVWAVGSGGTEVTQQFAEDPDGELGYNNIGNYMALINVESDDMRDNGIIQSQADATLARLHELPRTIEVECTPGHGPFYRANFGLGDVCTFQADKGALQVDTTLRIYEATCSIDESCLETTGVRAAPDFFTKVPLG